MSKPLKVAVLMPLATQRGGGELMLTHAVTFADRSVIRWLVVFLESGPMVDEYRALGIETFVVPSGRLRQPYHFARTVYRIFRILRRKDIAVIVSWMAKAHVYGGVVSLLMGIPSVWYQLGVDEARGSVDRFASWLPASAIITLSRASVEAQRRLSPRTPIRLIYPGADLDRFNAASLPAMQDTRRMLGLPVEGPIIGIAGRLQRWKGMHTLLAALPEILRVFPSVTCVIVGGVHPLEPEYPDQLAKLVRDHHLEDAVRFVGMQTNVNHWLHALDVVIHASDKEPFGIVVVEAMALRKAVVAGSEGGPAEIITDGVNGLLAPFEDSVALANCIMRYLKDPEFAACTGRKAAGRAREFSAAAYASNLVAAIQDVLGQNPGRTNA